jgi:hypothetical protein
MNRHSYSFEHSCGISYNANWGRERGEVTRRSFAQGGEISQLIFSTLRQNKKNKPSLLAGNMQLLHRSRSSYSSSNGCKEPPRIPLLLLATAALLLTLARAGPAPVKRAECKSSVNVSRLAKYQFS